MSLTMNSLFLAASGHNVPSMLWVLPFAALLLSIAILPLIHKTAHWWEHNRNRLLVAVVLAAITLVHYQTRGYGAAVHDATLVKWMDAGGLHVHEDHGHHFSEGGFAAVIAALGNAVFEYIPFIVLLFSLYTISGGISVRGDIPAHPGTNTAILAIGTVLASFIGTTGASMLLIRPLLQTNSERKHVVHTVVFFIFLVSNVGGCLLPIGDPPLFLGYLRGVPFMWTFGLWAEWLVMSITLLVVYFIWDTIAYRREDVADITLDETRLEPMSVKGKINILWLVGVVLAVALLDVSKKFPGTNWSPPPFLREAIQIGFVGLSYMTTAAGLRAANKFNFHAIAEVACLFIGIFITMQVPLEILNAEGAKLGLTKPWQFFWATGALSSFLDNAPTYVVFFQTANTLTHESGPGILTLLGGDFVRTDLLVAISLGSVFMGANTYIGNGPNFMVKSIAEQAGVKMPSFFGYMLYSMAILVPLFVGITFLFLLGH